MRYVAWPREKRVKRTFPCIRSCESNGSEINWIISGREAGRRSIDRSWIDPTSNYDVARCVRNTVICNKIIRV